MSLININNITLEQALKMYEEYNTAFIIKDGAIKGFTR